jgi:hypothetical protein
LIAMETFSHLAEPDQQTPDQFPKLSSLSAAFFYQFVPILKNSHPLPEYVAIPMTPKRDLALYGAIASWNMMWEAGVIRYEMLDDDEWFKGLEFLKRYEERQVDLRLIPLNGACRYNVYAPIYHLLPLGTLRKFGLPALKQGHWPGGPDWPEIVRLLPRDFDHRLEGVCKSRLAASLFRVAVVRLYRKRSARSTCPRIRLLAPLY